MSDAVCPRCGTAATGNFCSSCGASLAAVACPSCGETPAPGARFCNKCGTPLAGTGAPGAVPGAGPATARGDSQIAWWIAGTTLVALIVMMAWPVIHPKKEAEPAAGAQAPAAPFANGAAGGQPPDLSKMTPREAAERLFNRVMAAVENNDEATVQQFMPMALEAFDMAAPLDDLGMYELATLKRANGDFAGAMQTAEEGLAKKPDHLLFLAADAEAAESAQQPDKAKKQWQHFLDVFDRQHALGLQEYRDYEQLLQETKSHARQVAGG